MRAWDLFSISALTAGAVAVAAYAVNGRSSTLLAPSLWRGPQDRRALSLTFDDGPSESTPRLLDLLDSHNVKATFFLLGVNVLRLPRIAREILRRGHEIGSHGFAHPYYHLCTPAQVYDDIVAGQFVVEDTLGFSPWLFRPPYGLRWPGMRQAQYDCGTVGVQWSIMPKDWDWPPERIAQYLVERLHPGAVICLHDGRKLEVNPRIHNTLTAVRAFLLHPALDGFTLDTVTDLFLPELARQAEAQLQSA